jgi:hypothetical protein
MNTQPPSETGDSEQEKEALNRRLFLRSMGKWSGAAIAAIGLAGAWLASAPDTKAQSWINRRGPRRGGWINRWGPRRRGRWLNRWGPGGWIDRWGPGSWLNRW